MTTEEIKTLFTGVEFRFFGYYKYTFTYVTKINGVEYALYGGGDHNDIYRSELEDVMTFEKLNKELRVSNIYCDGQLVYEGDFV